MIGTSQLINTFSRPCFTDTTDIFKDGSGVALYTLDYDASDSGGASSGTPTDVDFGVGGQINYGARFNGSSSRINTGYQLPSGLSGFSVSAWVKAASVKTQFIVGDLGTGGASADGMFQINISSSNVLRAAVGGSVSQTIATISNYIDTWTHIVVTTDSSGNIVGYVNGSQVGTASGNSLAANTRDFIIGMFGDISHSSTFDGDLDQVRIFSKALNQTEVDTLYAETACVYTATTTDNYFPLADGSSDAVAYYKLDNSAEDSVGSNDGTETDIEYRFGRYGQAAVFNGSSSKIVTGVNSLTNTFAVSMWINPSSFSISRWVFNNWNSTTQDITWVLKTDGTFDILIDGGNTRFFGSSGDVTIDTWHHVVLTMDSGNYEVYLDSVSLGTGSTTNTSFANGQFYQIGSSPKTSASVSRFDGSIDQVRIYSTALDSDQVSQLYNEKPEYGI